jgi:hypothetical protein
VRQGHDFPGNSLSLATFQLTGTPPPPTIIARWVRSNTREMQADTASAGFYEHKMNKQKYPRIQLRAVRELMDGKSIERPSNVAAVDERLKKAPESKKKHGEQKELI